ncbi:hypothetical protein CHU92_08880 [Flavobacterium cyanobacteriorum]|uniref:DNA-binding response regulator n=1 Tax=Flavobacterium cyanobacteriorum TaxID=2022802 RepID=A0A255Z6N8_9FLAO|nr:LytTR family transcriptional regulator DNA-binding domain-containing protein [Flavobacterium cyanobacteriorum]OYQ37106.1 hypothetical protein CHU92_08880 [Flavobacterium cyanobacteriorum]
MAQFPYLIVSNNETHAGEISSFLENFPDFMPVGNTLSNESAVDAILEFNPSLVVLDISISKKNNVSLALISVLHQYMNQLPQFIIVADDDKQALEALKAGALDYMVRPLDKAELRRALFKFRKYNHYMYQQIRENHVPLPAGENTTDERAPNETQRSEVDIQICIKSYGDYQFISLKDVVYLEADNNTTDFYLVNGKKLSAYKTLKHYENNLPSFFYRIHNSYIVNSIFVSRINTGKQLCYLNNNEVSVPFSKTFKESIDTIIRTIAPEYL